MAELVPADVELFTEGRLLASDVETGRTLVRAYAAIRKYCGWFVTPPKTNDAVILDGTGDLLLPLPTRRIITLISVVEDGISLNLSDLGYTVNGRIMTKNSGAYWSRKPRAITVTMTHGFDTAPDFDEAVLELIDYVTTRRGEGGIRRHNVDDEHREWFGNSRQYETGINETLLEQYRLIPEV